MRVRFRTIRFGLVMVIYCVALGNANAGIAFQQPSRFPRHICDCWPSTRGLDGTVTQSFDDFQINETSLITEINWQGAYWDDQVGNELLNPVAPNTESWQIGVYHNDRNKGRDVPGAHVATQVIDVDRVQSSLLGTYPLGDFVSSQQGEFDYDVQVYDFHVVLDEPIELQADTKYWFSPLSESLTFKPFFVWTVSDLTGKSMQQIESQNHVRNSNFVFSLIKLDGDFNHDSLLNQTDISLLLDQLETGQLHSSYDLNQDGVLDDGDFETWVHEFKNTWFGDANLDREFNTRDLVQVFVTGKYETGMTATWSEGDWNADRLFNTSDLVVAFQDGGYEVGFRDSVRAVPEPTGYVLVLCFGAAALARWRLSRRRMDARREDEAGVKSWLLLCVCFVFAVSRPTMAQVLLESDFDDLPVGTAPSEGDPVGGWQFYDHVITANEMVNGEIEYRDRPLYLGEAFSQQVSIVEAQDVDPSREGNVLCISDGVSAFQVYHRFETPVDEQAGKLIRASFEFFSMHRAGAAGAFMILSGDGGGGGWASTWNRGPQLHFSETSLRSYECSSPSCRFFDATTQIDDYPDGVWQRLQLDIDLVSDTYDLFWAIDGEELSQIGDDLAFRAGDIDQLDRLGFAYFNENGFPNASDLQIFFDNIRVELVDVAAVPEPSAAVMAVFFLFVSRRDKSRTSSSANTGR